MRLSTVPTCPAIGRQNNGLTGRAVDARGRAERQFNRTCGPAVGSLSTASGLGSILGIARTAGVTGPAVRNHLRRDPAGGSNRRAADDVDAGARAGATGGGVATIVALDGTRFARSAWCSR